MKQIIITMVALLLGTASCKAQGFAKFRVPKTTQSIITKTYVAAAVASSWKHSDRRLETGRVTPIGLHVTSSVTTPNVVSRAAKTFTVASMIQAQQPRGFHVASDSLYQASKEIKETISRMEELRAMSSSLTPMSSDTIVVIQEQTPMPNNYE